MLIIGKKCPEFHAHIVWKKEIREITENDLKGNFTLLFFYAVDFSAVCPTEFFSLQNNIEEFEKRGVDIIAISVDSVYTHLAWLKRPRDRGGIEGVTFKILSDITQNISRKFGTFDEDQGLAFRGTFIIDQDLIVQYGAINNMSFGRSTEEILHVIDAIQYTAKHGLSCPANWHPGSPTIDTTLKA